MEGENKILTWRKVRNAYRSLRRKSEANGTEMKLSMKGWARKNVKDVYEVSPKVKRVTGQGVIAVRIGKPKVSKRSRIESAKEE